MFSRIIGPSNQRRLCSGGHSCPEILELDSGDFAIIGTDITANVQGKYLPGTGCGPTERVVQIPRALLVNARSFIPERL